MKFCILLASIVVVFFSFDLTKAQNRGKIKYKFKPTTEVPKTLLEPNAAIYNNRNTRNSRVRAVNFDINTTKPTKSQIFSRNNRYHQEITSTTITSIKLINSRIDKNIDSDIISQNIRNKTLPSHRVRHRTVIKTNPSSMKDQPIKIDIPMRLDYWNSTRNQKFNNQLKNIENNNRKQTKNQSLTNIDSIALSSNESRRTRSRTSYEHNLNLIKTKSYPTKAIKSIGTTSKLNSDNRIEKIRQKDTKIIDQIQDENYPEHFKLFIKGNQLKDISSSTINSILYRSNDVTNTSSVLFKPRRAEPYRPKPTSTEKSTTISTTKRQFKIDMITKYKPRINSRLQFPSLKTKILSSTKEPNELSTFENEIQAESPQVPNYFKYNSRLSIEPRHYSEQITNLKVTNKRLTGREPLLTQIEPTNTKVKPKVPNQKYTTRYRNDGIKTSFKTERHAPVYKPTVPQISTESMEDIVQNENTDKNLTPGEWKIIEPIQAKLLRNEIVIDSNNTPSTPVTVSIFGALAEILSKSTDNLDILESTSILPTTTTTTSTSSPTQPDISAILLKNQVQIKNNTTKIMEHVQNSVHSYNGSKSTFKNHTTNGHELQLKSSNPPYSNETIFPLLYSRNYSTIKKNKIDNFINKYVNNNNISESSQNVQFTPTFTPINSINKSTYNIENYLTKSILSENNSTLLPKPYILTILTTPASDLIVNKQNNLNNITISKNYIEKSQTHTEGKNIIGLPDIFNMKSSKINSSAVKISNINPVYISSRTSTSPNNNIVENYENSKVTKQNLLKYSNDTIIKNNKNINPRSDIRNNLLERLVELSTNISQIFSKMIPTTVSSSLKSNKTNLLTNISNKNKTKLKDSTPLIIDRKNFNKTQLKILSNLNTTSNDINNNSIGINSTELNLINSKSMILNRNYEIHQTTSNSVNIFSTILKSHENSIVPDNSHTSMISPLFVTSTLSTTIKPVYKPRFNNRIPILPIGTIISTTEKIISSMPKNKQEDFFIYGILPNNTVVRKRTSFKRLKPTLTSIENEFIIYGILPNQTIVKKYRNGTILPAENLNDDSEIVNIDPKMLFDPFSELYRTSYSSSLDNTINLVTKSSDIKYGPISSTRIPNLITTPNILSQYSTSSFSGTLMENNILADVLKKKYINSEVPSRSSNVFSLTGQRANVIKKLSNMQFDSALEPNLESENTINQTSIKPISSNNNTIGILKIPQKTDNNIEFEFNEDHIFSSSEKTVNENLSKDNILPNSTNMLEKIISNTPKSIVKSIEFQENPRIYEEIIEKPKIYSDIIITENPVIKVMTQTTIKTKLPEKILSSTTTTRATTTTKAENENLFIPTNKISQQTTTMKIVPIKQENFIENTVSTKITNNIKNITAVKPKQVQIQSNFLNRQGNNLVQNLEILRQLLGIQNDSITKTGDSTKSNIIIPTTITKPTTKPTTTTTTVTTTSRKPTTISTTASTSITTTYKITTTTYKTTTKSLITTLKPKTTFSDRDDLNFLQNLRKLLAGQTRSQLQPHTTARTTTKRLTDTIKAQNSKTKENLINPSYEQKSGTDDIDFLNSLRQIDKMSDITTPKPPTFSNRAIELTNKTTTSASVIKMIPTKVILSKEEIKNGQKDIAMVNADLQLLSTLLGRPISIDDIPNLIHQTPKSRQIMTSTTKKTTSIPESLFNKTPTQTKQNLDNIDANLKLLSTILGDRPYKKNEIELITTNISDPSKSKQSIIMENITSDPITNSINIISQDDVFALVKNSSVIGENIKGTDLYGSTNEAILAAVLKQRGIGPAHNNVPVNELFQRDEPPMIFTTSRRPRPAYFPQQRRPILDGLSWLWRTWQETAPTPRTRTNYQTAYRVRSPTYNTAEHQPDNGGLDSLSTSQEDEERLESPSLPGGGLLNAALGVTRAVTQFLGAALQNAARSVQSAWTPQSASGQNNPYDYYRLSGG